MPHNYKILALSLAIFLCLLACKPRHDSTNVQSLAFDSTAPNIAVMLAAPNKSKTGSEDDLSQHLERAFPLQVSLAKTHLASQNFQVVPKYQATKADAIAVTSEALKAANARSTLFWFFNGHGQQGKLLMEDGQLVSLQDILNALTKNKIHVHRIIFILSACYSGQAAVDLTTYALDAVSKIPADEVFFLAAATPIEKSLLTPDYGDIFSNVLFEEWKTFERETYETASIGAWFDVISQKVRTLSESEIKKINSDKEPHKPIFFAYPDADLLNNLLFKEGRSSQPKAYANVTINPASATIKEINPLPEGQSRNYGEKRYEVTFDFSLNKAPLTSMDVINQAHTHVSSGDKSKCSEASVSFISPPKALANVPLGKQKHLLDVRLRYSKNYFNCEKSRDFLPTRMTVSAAFLNDGHFLGSSDLTFELDGLKNLAQTSP